MKIVQFGLHYSPKVGDGIISECLAHACRKLRPGCDFQTIDISGRETFGQEAVRNRGLALAILRTLPRPIRQRIVANRLTALLNRVEPQWNAAVKDADLAILGGGQIFSDADLNFCLKIARAAQVIRAHDIPLAIHAAGVSRNWSRKGSALFNQVFQTDLRAIGLRDAPSIAAWTDQVQTPNPEPHLTRDPGLLAADCYGPQAQPSGRIGLCVTTPDILTYHADDTVAGVSTGGLGFFRDVALALVALGERVTLFCNGAHEDRAALHQLAAMPEIADAVTNGTIEIARAPITPSDLAAIVSACRAVIAHRLHACIVAYAFRIPTVGLGWDKKVKSFFNSVQNGQFFVESGSADANAVATLAVNAIETGIDPAQHEQVVNETYRAVSDVLYNVKPLET